MKAYGGESGSEDDSDRYELLVHSLTISYKILHVAMSKLSQRIVLTRVALRFRDDIEEMEARFVKYTSFFSSSVLFFSFPSLSPPRSNCESLSLIVVMFSRQLF